MTVNGGASADERRQSNLQSTMKMGYHLSQIMTNTPDPLLNPPSAIINFGLDSLQYAWLPVIIMALIQEDCSFTYVEETIQQLKTENVLQNCKLIVSTFCSTN